MIKSRWSEFKVVFISIIVVFFSSLLTALLPYKYILLGIFGLLCFFLLLKSELYGILVLTWLLPLHGALLKIFGIDFEDQYSIIGAVKDVLTLGVVISWFMHTLLHKRIFIYTPLVWLTFFVIYIWIGTLVTVIEGPKGWLAAVDLRSHWEFIILAFVTSTISHMDWCKRIFYMIISGGVVSAFVGLISKWIEGSLFDLSSRSMGILGGMISVNGYGVFFAIIILALLSLLLWDYNLRGRARIFSIITLAIMMLSLLLTYSRGAWLSGLIGISVIIWLVTNSRVPRTRILILFVALVFAVFLITKVPYVQYRILQIIPGWVTDDPTQTLEGRFSQWRLELASLQVPQLLFGSGLGSTGSYLSRHITLHNYYLLLLKETGLVGLGLYVGTIVSSLISAWWQFRSSDSFAKVVSAAVIVTLVAMAVGGLFDYVNTGIPVSPTVWILVGMSIAIRKIGNKNATKVHQGRN